MWLDLITLLIPPLIGDDPLLFDGGVDDSLGEFASDAKQTNVDLWPNSGFPEALEHQQKSDCAASSFAFFFVAPPTCDGEPGARDALWTGQFWETPRV